MTKIIEEIQSWLEAQNLEYLVKAETFLIDGDGPKPFKYVPNYIILNKRFRKKVIIVEPITSFVPQGGLKRLQTFKQQFSNKYHVVIITRSRMQNKIPSSAYDQLVEFEKLDKTKIRFC